MMCINRKNWISKEKVKREKGQKGRREERREGKGKGRGTKNNKNDNDLFSLTSRTP